MPPDEKNIKPSEIVAEYWVFAERAHGRYPAATRRSGKWLVFVLANDMDRVWEKIRKATEEGKLGDSSKVATAKINPNSPNRNSKVICVYTYDSADLEDVKRIREELRNLGITKKIPYKTDEDTLCGKYEVRGHKYISKYYE